VDIKVSKSGKWYAAVNNWKPEQQPAEQGKPFNDKIPSDELEDLPF